MSGRGRGRHWAEGSDDEMQMEDGHHCGQDLLVVRTDTTHIAAEPLTFFGRQPTDYTSENTLFNFCFGITVMIRSKLLIARDRRPTQGNTFQEEP